MKHKDLPRALKSKPTTQNFKEDQVDSEKGIITGVIMCSVGEAKGHGVHLEQGFINELIAYDKKNFSKTGIKARFGHPAMSDTTMGKQMGTFHNFRVEGENAVADLHLLDSANISPTNPNMKDWMLSMAKERPDFVMSSIVFRAGGYYQRDENGKEFKIWYYKIVKDEDGEEATKWVSANPEYGKIFVAFGKEGEHFYTDLVEQGAATDNLFANQFNQDKFAVQAVEFVKEHPALHTFLKKNPNKLITFAEQVGITLPKASFNDKLNAFKNFLFGEPKEGEVSPQAALQQAQTQFESDLETARMELSEKHENEMEGLNTNHATQVSKLNQEVLDLKNQLTELKKRVPDEPTDIDPAAPGVPEKFDAVTQKAIDRYERRNKGK